MEKIHRDVIAFDIKQAASSLCDDIEMHKSKIKTPVFVTLYEYFDTKHMKPVFIARYICNVRPVPTDYPDEFGIKVHLRKLLKFDGLTDEIETLRKSFDNHN